jgi:putative aldouronate transport system substrate-binding protein
MVMKNKIIKVTTLALTLVIILSSAACNTKQTKTESNLPKDDGPLKPYDNLVTIKVPIVESPSLQYIDGENSEDNLVTRFYTEKLNIKFKASWTVDTSQQIEKINAAVAANRLPDAFVAGPELISRLVKADQIEPLDKYFEKYASDKLKTMCNYQDGKAFVLSKINGVTYGIPRPGDFSDATSLLYIRKDWLDKIGKKTPKTMHELLEIAKLFRDKDPDGNGINDTIPIGWDKNFSPSGSGFVSLVNPFNAFYSIWIKDGNGGLKYSSIQPEMKTALGFMQNLYKEKLVDPEFAVKDEGKVAADVAAGKIGIVSGFYWAALYPLLNTIDNNKKADWVPLLLPVNKDNKHVVQSKLFSTSCFVVRKGFSNPEALIKTLNLWVEIFEGQYREQFSQLIQSEKYNMIIDSWHKYALPDAFGTPEGNYNISANLIKAFETKDSSKLDKGKELVTWNAMNKDNPTGWAYRKVFLETEPLLKKYDSVVLDEFIGAPTKTMILRNASLQKLEGEMVTNIIVGGDLKLFDTFVADWKAQGGDTITQEVNQWYVANK